MNLRFWKKSKPGDNVKHDEPEDIGEVEEEEESLTIQDHIIHFVDGEVMCVTACERGGTETSTHFINQNKEIFVEFMDRHIKMIECGEPYELSEDKKCECVEVQPPKYTSIAKQNRIDSVE